MRLNLKEIAKDFGLNRPTVTADNDLAFGLSSGVPCIIRQTLDDSTVINGDYNWTADLLKESILENRSSGKYTKLDSTLNYLYIIEKRDLGNKFYILVADNDSSHVLKEYIKTICSLGDYEIDYEGSILFGTNVMNHASGNDVDASDYAGAVKELCVPVNAGPNNSILPILWLANKEATEEVDMSADYMELCKDFSEDGCKAFFGKIEEAFPPVDLLSKTENRYVNIRFDTRVFTYNRNHVAYNGNTSALESVYPVLLHMYSKGITGTLNSIPTTDDKTAFDDVNSKATTDEYPKHAVNTGNPLVDALKNNIQ